MFDSQPKVDVILKQYPTYSLVARVLEKDKERFLETKDEKLILYKFCQNTREYTPIDVLNEKRTRRLYKR